MDEALKVRVAGRRLPAAEVMVVTCFEGEGPLTAGLPRRVASAARGAAGRPGWQARLGAVSFDRCTHPGLPTVAVAGLGQRSGLDSFQLATALDRSARRLARDGFRTAVFSLPDHPLTRERAGAMLALRTLAAAPYRFERFRASRRRRGGLRSIAVVPPAGSEGEYRAARGTARHLADGIACSRRLADTPPNVASPGWMAERAAELANRQGMECLVLGPPDLEERGMGGMLAVAAGSRHEPRLVRLRWGEGNDSVALVGKGVTFDSGGLSLKPAASMDEMKFDKAGACTVLGLAQALAAAEVPGRFSAYLALAENMPGGESYRPGDIVTCANGTTVEILNTDAEGRMLLADALSWAAEDAPDVTLDFATLTGACVVALGKSGAGLFTPSDELAAELLASAAAAGERLWRLPLWPGFTTALEGRHADLKNVAGRWGGASTAAAFLSHFVPPRGLWAHFDIAGPAYRSKGRDRFGATGYGVATAFDWLLRRGRDR